MRVLLQRVARASVKVDDSIVGRIDAGLLVFAGFEDADTDEDIDWISKKIVQLRIFNDDQSVMNCSLLETGGDLLLVSQFTLHAATKKGNRPSYIRASKPEVAVPVFEKLHRNLETQLGKKVATGMFGADMKVDLLNDGPVTIWIDSKKKE